MIFGKHVNKYYLKYWYLFLLGFVALVAVDWFQLKIPELYKVIINTLKNEGKVSSELITTTVLKMIGIAFIMFAGRFVWRNCVFGASIRIVTDIREELFNKSLKLSTRYYKEHKTGALLAYFTSDLESIEFCFSEGVLMTIDALFLGIFTFIKMQRLNLKLALFALIPLALICVISIFTEAIMEKKYDKRQKAYERLSDYTQENFSGISVIKAFVNEQIEIRHFLKVNKENQNANISFTRFGVILDVLFTLVMSSCVALLYLAGSIVIVKGTADFDIGELVEFISYFGTITWPMLAVAYIINIMAQGRASLKRISVMLDEQVEIKDNDDLVDIDSIKGKIEFKNLNFHYPDSKLDVLHDISFTINQGEMVGIIGRTGCGKSTVVDLLLRTYNIDEKKLFIDDKDIMHLPIKKVRDSIGYVPQDNFLFSDSIQNNIGFAFEKADDIDVESAARFADVHQNILDFENKYKTVIGERGVTLSGGQKQRVSIARAVIKNPQILILDDSVSAVDTKTEESILHNLKEVRHGKTTILIAHRISTVRELDKIIVMNEGKVEAVGKHEELLKSSKTYKEIVELQSLEQEVEGGAF